MFVSVFDMFKVGIGPSSSHTIGPMKAARAFARLLGARPFDRIQVDLYGSLSLTGRGHATDDAIIMGLAGQEPDTVDIDAMPEFLSTVRSTHRLPMQARMVDFDPSTDILFHRDYHPAHENTMMLTAYRGGEVAAREGYCSIGGGFISSLSEMNAPAKPATSENIPYPFSSAAELTALCTQHGITIAQLGMANELAVRSRKEVDAHLARIWDVMRDAIERGIRTEGVLPGPMKLQRRAPGLKKLLDDTEHPHLGSMSWLNLYAMAINETNAAGGRVVTAPTNGACGIVPAVLAGYEKLMAPVNKQAYTEYFMVCSQIGALYKMNASISGAEVGCQGEVGVACSMAAGGLAALMGGSAEQICSAAEIGMEHNLGLTCDPVGGQVQVPCIERNAIGAVKAVNSAALAMGRGTQPAVSLDAVINTMYVTGRDMHSKYRETSKGGLALTVLPCT